MDVARHHGLVPPVRIDPTGIDGPTRGQARGPHWRRTSHGFYVPTAVDAANVDQRILEASVVVPPGWTGVPRARWARDHGSENSWSPAETRMGLVWELDGGYPRPLHNQPLFDRSGRHIGTPDLLDPVAGVVGEYDGAHHLEREQRVIDVNREEAFRVHDLEVVTWLAGDPRTSFLRYRAA